MTTGSTRKATLHGAAQGFVSLDVRVGIERGLHTDLKQSGLERLQRWAHNPEHVRSNRTSATNPTGRAITFPDQCASESSSRHLAGAQ
jgi:hypothetical protein